MNNLNTYNHYININSKWRLTPQQIDELQQKGLTQKDIGEVHRRTDRTIRYWKKWTGENLQKRGRKLRIIDNVLKKLISYVENNNTTPLIEISDYLFRETGQRFSVPTIFRTLEREKKPLKKATKQHINQNKEKVKQFITDNSWLLSLDSLLAVDECGFKLGVVPSYARADKGQRAVVKRPTRGWNHTLLLCVQNVNQKAVIHYQLTKPKEIVDTKVFYDFLEGINLTNKDKHYLLLDNAGIHYGDDKRVKILKLPTIKEQARKKNIELKYLVSYAPELNPTEKCFNFIKHYYRKARPKTFAELEKVIKETIEKLQQQDLRKFFRSCFDYESWHKKKIKSGN